jgi:hypothetical protein
MALAVTAIQALVILVEVVVEVVQQALLSPHQQLILVQ